MPNKPTKQLLKEYDKLLLWASLILTILLALVYFFATEIFQRFGTNTVSFVQNLITEFLPIGVTFIISYFIFRKVQDIKEKQSVEDMTHGISENLIPQLQKFFLINKTDQAYYLVDFTKIDWETLLAGAVRIDIIVHYFDTWIRNNDAVLEAVFKRNGTIRIIIPNAENKVLVKQVKNRFPEYDEKLVKSKIQNTKKKLQMILERVQSGTLEVFETDELGYYCCIRIDERIVVYSSYDHIRDNMRIEAPSFIIKLEKEPAINGWFEKEFSGLIQR